MPVVNGFVFETVFLTLWKCCCSFELLTFLSHKREDFTRSGKTARKDCEAQPMRRNGLCQRSREKERQPMPCSPFNKTVTTAPVGRAYTFAKYSTGRRTRASQCGRNFKYFRLTLSLSRNLTTHICIVENSRKWSRLCPRPGFIIILRRCSTPQHFRV